MKKVLFFCTYLDSVKGEHIAYNSKAAMTIWWDHVGYQISVVGTAEVITDVAADVFWQTRSRSAQLTITAFDQSELLVAESDLTTRLQGASTSFAEKPIPRPNNWGQSKNKSINGEVGRDGVKFNFTLTLNNSGFIPTIVT